MVPRLARETLQCNVPTPGFFTCPRLPVGRQQLWNCCSGPVSWKLAHYLGFASLFFCCRNHLVRFEPELSLQFLQWRRSPKGFHAHDLTRGADISLPAKGGGLLYGHPCCDVRWQHALTVGPGLLLKNFPRWHRYHA